MSQDEKTNAEKLAALEAVKLGTVEPPDSEKVSILAAALWQATGDRESESLGLYVYDSDFAAVRSDVGLSFERFEHGTEEIGGGRGHVVVLTPTVPGPERPACNADDDLYEE